MNKYIAHTDADIKEMLQVIGAEKIEDLFSDVPESVMLNREFDLDKGKSELEVQKIVGGLAGQNSSDLVCFLGAGAYDHYCPSVVNHMLLRSEFYTAYTPYQPEISQGTLTYIFEFQTMMANLCGMDVSNASVYDGPTAVAEAMFMMANATKGNKVLVSKALNPNIINVLETYATYRDIEIEYIPVNDGVTDQEFIKNTITKEYNGVIVQSPNFYGNIEDMTDVSEVIHENKALLTMSVDPSTLAVLKTPREMGADIAVGDAQTLGLALNYGGPYLGFMTTTKKLVRKMPGRICGESTDVDGKRAFVLTLQAREQHIRREKANSNICSNQSLNALATTIYLSTMGEQGLKDVAMRSMNNAHYTFNELIKSSKFTQVHNQPFFKEFVVKYEGDVDELNKKLAEKGYLGGLNLGTYDEKLNGQILIAVTEKRTKEEIDTFVKLMEELA
jgi:glycine dehydrogenase subunit 1